MQPPLFFTPLVSQALRRLAVPILLVVCGIACGESHQENSTRPGQEKIKVVKSREKLDAVEVPEVVIKSFMRRHPKATDIQWSRTTGNGQPVYLVKFTEKGKGTGEYSTAAGEPIDEGRIKLVNAAPDTTGP